MPYLKFQADHLFTGTQLLDHEHVLVTDSAGTITDIVPVSDAGTGVQQYKGVLSPGFINCHCHLELSHMRGLLPEHTGLVDFVFKVVTQRHFPEEEIMTAINHAENEMLGNGIVAVGDICNNLLTLPQKERHRLQYYNFIETSGWLPALAGTRFDKSLQYVHAYKAHHQRVSLSPHAPYSVSDDLWQLMIPFFDGNTVTIHNQETLFEDDFFIKASGDFNRMYRMMHIDTSFFRPSGKSSLQSYLPNMKSAKKALLVHNTFTKEGDIVFANDLLSDISWCICINANQYIEYAVPPIDLLRKNNCTVVIGTDSLASNHSLSILDEMKTIFRYFPGLPLAEVLQWATINGARALQMDDRLGSFDKGKKPGVVLIKHLAHDGIGSNSSVQRLV